jgi:hypothetical protein
LQYITCYLPPLQGLICFPSITWGYTPGYCSISAGAQKNKKYAALAGTAALHSTFVFGLTTSELDNPAHVLQAANDHASSISI